MMKNFMFSGRNPNETPTLIRNKKGVVIPTATLILVLIVFGFLGAKQGWFKGITYSYVTNTQVIERLDDAEDSECTLAFYPAEINEGETIIGTIRDGANTPCNVYANDGTGWRNVFAGTTDVNGLLTRTEVIGLAGTFQVRAICGDCLTNQETIIINPLPDDEGVCTDSDGLNPLTAGFVTYEGVYYDNCAGNWAVTEYYCDGGVMDERIFGCEAGYICTETPTGDYCTLSSGDGGGEEFTLEECANYCKDRGYSGATNHPEAQGTALCESDSRTTCESEFGLPFLASTYSSINKCCCFECAW